MNRAAQQLLLPEAPDADTGRLVVQLRSVDQLCRLLFDAHIATLTSIERDRFEEAAASAGAMADAAMLDARMGGRAPAQPARTPEPAEELFQKERFVISFAAREEAFWEVMNRLVKSKPFVTVTDVVLKNEKSQPARIKPTAPRNTMIRPSPGMPADFNMAMDPAYLEAFTGAPMRPDMPPDAFPLEPGLAEPFPGTPAPGTGVAGAGTPQLDTRTHDERVVAGQERLLATLTLDLYRFPKSAEPAAEGPR